MASSAALASSAVPVSSWANSKRRSPLSLYLMTYLVVWATVVSACLVFRVCRSAQFRAGTANDFDRMRQGGLARHADSAAVDGVDRDVPETGAGGSDARRKRVECTAVIGVTAAILEAAEVGVVHQTDVAHLGA